ncbi:hypothetical protein D3C78_1541720 [compost metagenome]
MSHGVDEEAVAGALGYLQVKLEVATYAGRRLRMGSFIQCRAHGSQLLGGGTLRRNGRCLYLQAKPQFDDRHRVVGSAHSRAGTLEVASRNGVDHEGADTTAGLYQAFGLQP